MDHEAPPTPHVLDKVKDVHRSFIADSQELTLDGDEGTCSSHSSTAVDYHRPGIPRVTLSDFPHKVEQGGGLLGHSVIGPNGKVEMSYNPLTFRSFHLQGECSDGVCSQDQTLLESDLSSAMYNRFVQVIGPILVAFNLKSNHNYCEPDWQIRGYIFNLLVLSPRSW